MILGLAALFGILGLIWVVQRGVRGSSLIRPSANGRLRLVQSLAIDPKRRLVLLQCDKREILLLVGGTHDMMLHSEPSVPLAFQP